MQEVFVVSDIHGHYKELVTALEEAGFDENDDNHHLLCLGDMFDRGQESKEVYLFLRRLEKKGKATVLLGNHETFLIEFFAGKDDRVLFNIAHNGFQTTLESFSGLPYRGKHSLAVMRETIRARFPELKDWLKNLPLFIEKDDYVFLHGGVDGSDPDWRNTPEEEIVWNYQSRLPAIPGKTIICGHERIPHIHMAKGFTSHSTDDEDVFAPIEEKGVVHIDAAVETSKRINVYRVKLQDPL